MRGASSGFTSLAFRLWLGAGLLLLVASGSAYGFMPFMGLFVLVGWLAWGAQVWILGLAFAFQESERGRERRILVLRRLLQPPLVVLVLWALSGSAVRWSSTLWAHVELWRHRPEYLALVEGLAGGGARVESDLRMQVDDGEPLRVAFPWGTGLVDNWRAIVHDPTGVVLRAEDAWEADADDPEVRLARDLFGGHLVRCVHLSGPFYYCVFT